jgi:hypothetical protein
MSDNHNLGWRLDFVTGLTPDQCQARLKRAVQRTDPPLHFVEVRPDGMFIAERRAGILSMLRGARQQPVKIRFRGTITAGDGGTHIRGALAPYSRARMEIERWRVPAVMLVVVAMLPYHAFGTVIALLIVLAAPVLAVSWWRWARLRGHARTLLNALYATLYTSPRR